MLPKDLQERILDKCVVSWDKVKESDAMTIFNKVKEEVKNIAKSRRDICTPQAMAVDNVWAESWEDDYKEDREEGHEDEGEVNLVGKENPKGKGKGKGMRYSCGEFGHRAAECPSKGKGKGQNGKGKGNQKGASWNSGWAPPACFGCGSTAHLLKDARRTSKRSTGKSRRSGPTSPRSCS